MPGHVLSRHPLAVRASVAVALMALTFTAGTAAGPAKSGALRESEWALTALKADRAWNVSKGAGVTVAVIGSGVEASHPDLRGRIVPGADFGDGSTVNATRDQGAEGGQGTNAAGIIAGTARNYHGDGLYGLAPEARVLPLRVYRNSKPVADASAKAIRYAVRHGAKVIDVSVEFATPNPALRSAVKYAIGKDVVVVAGAGDNGSRGNRPTYPASFPGVVAVSATDKKGALWPDSHRGKAVSLAAPGVSILTTARGGEYWTGDGTSYAAPWVAASAALLRSEHPRWTARQVVRQLIDTADHKGSAGRNQHYGYGIVAPSAALADRTPPAADPALKGQSAQQPDRSAAPAGDSSEGSALLTVGVVTAALVVLAIIGFVLVSRRKGTPDAE